MWIKDRHQQWLDQIQHHPTLTRLAEQDSQLNYRHLKTYLDTGFSARRKLDAVSYTMRTLHAHLGDARFDAVMLGDGITLAELPLKDGGTVSLTLVRSTFPREGEIALQLTHPEWGQLYMMSFSLGTPATLLIGGMQGTSEMGLVKLSAKQLHGLRPQNLMVSAVTACARALDMTAVEGISDRAHPRRKRLKSSYDRLWKECAGVKKGHWFSLSLEEPERDIATVKSQHRSAFRRREALRADMIASIETALSGNARHFRSAARQEPASVHQSVVHA